MHGYLQEYVVFSRAYEYFLFNSAFGIFVERQEQCIANMQQLFEFHVIMSSSITLHLYRGDPLNSADIPYQNVAYGVLLLLKPHQYIYAPYRIKNKVLDA